jgi:hypothetical protein
MCRWIFKRVESAWISWLIDKLSVHEIDMNLLKIL